MTMLGAIIGDIAGSIWEFRPAKSSYPLLGQKNGVTDDSIMTVAVADALLHDFDVATTLRYWARAIPIDNHLGGYGEKFGAWLAAPSVQPPYHSYGNGGAMRVSPAAGLATSLAHCLEMARRVTIVTHNHPSGLKGALATAHAIWMARQGQPHVAIRSAITTNYGYDLQQSVASIRANHRYNETAAGCVPEALTCALEANDFEEALRNAISLGGDADTLAAIAGGLAESLFGIPAPLLATAWDYIPESMQRIITLYYQGLAANSGQSHPVKRW